jgi:cytochrome b pre-mRNA-processing protein 3
VLEQAFQRKALRVTVSLISRLLGKRPDSRDAVRPLWHRVVEIARERAWYAEGGVADTVPGRFDAVTLVLALVMLRMERDKHAPAGGGNGGDNGGVRGDDRLIEPSVRLTELFVDDMDGQLRQSGVGDLGVGKRMGRLMSVLGGRIGAFREALAGHDDVALAQVLERNLTLSPGADMAWLKREVRRLHADIDSLSFEDLMAARISR